MGLIHKLGVSVYYPQQVYKIFERYPLDIVQLPLSVYDQRFKISGCLEFLSKLHVEIHVRSVFLQGLLLMDLGRIPSYFNPVLDKIKNYYYCLDELKISKCQAAFNFIKSCDGIDYAIVGVQTAGQLMQLYEAWNSREYIPVAYDDFAFRQEEYCLPSKWVI